MICNGSKDYTVCIIISMSYGEHNNTGSILDTNVPSSLQRARERNSLTLAQMRSADLVERAVLKQEVEDLTFAHTGQTPQEIEAARDEYYTRMMHSDADLGWVALNGWD